MIPEIIKKISQQITTAINLSNKCTLISPDHKFVIQRILPLEDKLEIRSEINKNENVQFTRYFWKLG